MAFDEMLVQHLVEGTGLPTVRVYQWKPWAVSLGHHQNAADIDARRCAEEGIEIVRRPTGGRAILHAEELTYSVVMPTNEPGIQGVYNRISEALVAGLASYGVLVTLQRSQPNFAELYKSPSSVPCFGSSARYEIEWNGRKLVGSAQRRYGTGGGAIVLQHGSILCGPSHHRLADLLTSSDPDFQRSVHTVLEQKTTDLEHITRRPVNTGHLAECLKQGFESTWGIRFVEPIHVTSKEANA